MLLRFLCLIEHTTTCARYCTDFLTNVRNSCGAETGRIPFHLLPFSLKTQLLFLQDDNREYERAGGDLYGVPLLDELDESSATNAKAVVRCDLLAAFDSADGGGALPTVAEFRRAITAAAVERALASLATPAPGPVDEILPFGEFPQLAPAPLAPAAGAGDALLGLAAAGGLSDENAALVAGGIFATSFGGVGAGVVDLDLPDLGDLGDLPDFL